VTGAMNREQSKHFFLANLFPAGVTITVTVTAQVLS
jgi:hypothetical protein